MFAQLVAFIRLGRLQFLGGGFLAYGLGAAAALATGAAVSFSLRRYLAGQATITALQLMTHYANDYFDRDADVANRTPTRWSGGSRILANGTLPPKVALIAALILAAAGSAGAVAIAWRPETRAAGLVLLAAGALAWAYSAPPARLCARGWGELTTAIVVTALTPATGALMQAGTLPLALCGALVPVVGLQFAMLLAIEFPDREGDAKTGKRTLVVRLGAPAAALLYRGTLIAIYAAIPLLTLLGAMPPLVGWGAAAGLPLAALQYVALRRGAWDQQARWEWLTAVAVAMVAVTAAAELVAFALLARSG